jgi:exonuclease SbcD
MRFLHAADIHLDSPLRGLSRYEGAPVDALRGATRQAFVKLVDEALSREVDFLLIAGDLYDGDWRDYNTGLFFSKQMARLNQADIPVVMICGNHDAESKITRGLRLPKNVTMLSVDQPETHLLEHLEVAIHGQGFKTPAVWEDLTENYPARHSSFLNIGMLHTGLEGRADHACYAPCTLDGLRSLGYDYWALGHIHQREVLCEDPYVVFCGNLQGRHARETGSKGATLVTVADGIVTSLEHLCLDVVRWERLEVDISQVESADEVVQEVGKALQSVLEQLEGQVLAARIITTGSSPAHAALIGERDYWTNEIRNLALQLGPDTIWIEKVEFASRLAANLQEMAEQHDAFASLLIGLEDLSSDEERLKLLGEKLFSKLEQKLPLEWRDPESGGLSPTSLEAVKNALADVAPILASRLSERGETLT